MHTSVRRIALAALALPLLLAGCADDDPVPKIPDTSTPTASVTETSDPVDPVEPTLPPEAEGKGNEAAEAFVRYYFETVDYAQATGNTRSLRSLGSPVCTACTAGADGIDAIYRQGGRISGGEDTVDRAKVTGVRKIPEMGEIYYLSVDVSNTDQSVSGTKNLDGEFPADQVKLRFQVTRTGVGYQILKWYLA